MSYIYYKLRSAKDSDYDVFTFDGPGATVFDLKREIIRAKKLGKGTDFDLAVYNAQTDEEYKDDVFVVPRNTSVVVRRLPAQRPGKGTAQRYVLGVLPTDGSGVMKGGPPGAPGSGTGGPPSGAQFNPGRNMVLNAQRPHQTVGKMAFHSGDSPAAAAAAPASVDNNEPKDDSEEARINAFYEQEKDQWGATQERLAEQQYIPYNNARGGGGAGRGRGGFQGAPGTHGQMGGGHGDNKDGQMPQRVPPPTYVCYRCGQKGHYINQCPTNGDKDYDKHPRIKRTTGIPRSFLKVIEEPKDAVKAGTGGLMVTPKGDIVVAQADSSSWDKHVSKAANTLGLGSAGDLMDWYDSIPAPSHLQCTLCNGILREATITPCCGTSFCDECIRAHLMENDFKCPSCENIIQNGLDGLVPNVDVRVFVDNYVRKFANENSNHHNNNQMNEDDQ